MLTVFGSTALDTIRTPKKTLKICKYPIRLVSRSTSQEENGFKNQKTPQGKRQICDTRLL